MDLPIQTTINKINPDVKRVYDALVHKTPTYNQLDKYYHGDQPTVFLTARLRKIFRPMKVQFTENWCAVVIDACNERIDLTGFECQDESIQELLRQAWDRNDLGNESDDIHLDAQIIGECFAIVWPADNGAGSAEVFYNDPRQVHVFYEEENPRVISAAGKMWVGLDGKAKLTLYYKDRLEYYTSTVKAGNLSNASAFVVDTSVYPTGQALNPYDKVPVFHFKVNRAGYSDLINVLPLQNGCNKLLSDMMIAAEFGAYLQRWVISDSDTTNLKNEPGEIMHIPAGDGEAQDSSVGTFNSTDLDNYLKAIDKLAAAIAIITRTPKQYFFTQGGDPSGEALIAMESPLNKKAKDRIDRFTTTWRDLAAFICQVDGLPVANSLDITPVFTKPETVQPLTQALIIKSNVDATIPLETVLFRQGWTQAQIDAMKVIKDENAAKAQENLANAMITAQAKAKTEVLPANGRPPFGGAK